MDTNQLRGIILNILSEDLEIKSLALSFEGEHKLRIEIISDSFKGMRFLNRTNLIIKKLANLQSNELSHCSLILNPLTSNEKNNGISETSLESLNDERPKAKIASKEVSY